MSSLFLALVLLVNGCGFAGGPAATGTAIVSPFKGAPVTVTLNGRTLIVANHTSDNLYYVAYPSEILPVIEWAPCLAPELCPAEQRIESGQLSVDRGGKIQIV